MRRIVHWLFCRDCYSLDRKAISKITILLALGTAGCGIRGYKFANHPGQNPDCSAGDITHASEPGARVVVPKKPKQ